MTTKPLVLITGGAGFIGSHTADALIAGGYRVRILDSLLPQVHGDSGQFPAYLPSDVDCVWGDVRNPDTMGAVLDDVAFVFHFAALTGVGQSSYDIRSYVDTNVLGTSTLLETVVKNRFPVKRIVLASSRAVYGEGDRRCPTHGLIHPLGRDPALLARGEFDIRCPRCGRPTQATPTSEQRLSHPLSIYGWTKKLQEENCEFAVSQFGIPVVSLRYFNVYGRRQSLRNPYSGLAPAFIRHLQAGRPLPLYERGMPTRDFVHVSDVVQANLAAIERDLPAHSAINVGSGQAASIRDVALTVSRAMGCVPAFDDRGEYRVGDVADCIADLELARHVLGFEPRVSLEEGLADVVAWALDQDNPDTFEHSVAELRRFGMLRQAASGGDRG